MPIPQNGQTHSNNFVKLALKGLTYIYCVALEYILISFQHELLLFSTSQACLLRLLNEVTCSKGLDEFEEKSNSHSKNGNLNQNL